VVSPGFVARSESWQLGHGALTMDFRAACNSCSITNSFVTNVVLIERAVSCWHLHLQLISQTTQYLDSWLSGLLQSKLKMKLEVEGVGARAPVPHSWGDATVLRVIWLFSALETFVTMRYINLHLPLPLPLSLSLPLPIPLPLPLPLPFK